MELWIKKYAMHLLDTDTFNMDKFQDSDHSLDAEGYVQTHTAREYWCVRNMR